MKRHIAALPLLMLNLAACAAFLALRPPAIPVLEERERMRHSPGDIFLISGDAYTFVANRPLRSWSAWHGGEEFWVKAIEVLNFPALAVGKSAGDLWSNYASPRGIGSVAGDSWVRAYVYVIVSSLQWALIGAFVAPAVTRRRARHPVHAS
jgi:hypothetical protein